MGDLLVADHDLDDAARLTQVEEGDATVVAAARHPPGQRDLLTGVLRAEGAGFVGADQRPAPSSLVVMVGRRSLTGGDHEVASASTCSPERMSLTWSGSPPLPGNHT